MTPRARAQASVAIEIARCEAKRDELDRRIARLRRVAVWLARVPVTPNPGRAGRRPPVRETGGESLTYACRAVLRGAAPRAVTPIEVRDALSTLAFPWTRFTNPMAAVHTVLKRLVDQREAVAAIDARGDRRYGTRPVAAIGLDRDALADDAFLKRLLAADSPEAAIKLVQARRARPR